MSSTRPELYRDATGILKLLLTCVLVGLAGGIWFSYLRPTSLGGPASYVIVNGPSMRPALDHGDLAFLQEQPNYYVGEIVAVRVKNSVAIHRIVALEGNTYITRGDNRTAPDTWRPTNAEIDGRMVRHIPSVGRLTQSQYTPLFLGLLVGMLATIALTGGRRERRKADIVLLDEVHEFTHELRDDRDAGPSKAA